MTEELKVVLRRSSECSGFGFSLLGTKGPPHVIYEIDENSPAADCGAVEAGDIILKVNGIDVHRYTTKEVLKCLRLSDESVTLDLKRDPKLKAHIKEQLAKAKSPHYIDTESHNIYDYQSTTTTTTTTSPKSSHQPPYSQQPDSPHNYSSNSYTAAASSTSPATRFKSPTHLPTQRQTAAAAAASSGFPSPSAGHSRNSSGSSAQIQLGDTNTGGGVVTSPTGSTASPTCRPSRIPTALKCPQKIPSPLNKRPRPSQIPTKASIAAAAAVVSPHANSSNGTAARLMTADAAAAHTLQHSYSYSGTSSTRYQAEPENEHEHETNSAPVQAPKAPPRFEAFMMTGDLILNLSRTPQSSNLLTAHAKKVDSLRDTSNRSANRANGALAPRASGESSPTSSSSIESPTHTASSDSVNLPKSLKDKTRFRHQYRHQPHQQHRSQQERDNVNNSYNNSGGSGGVADEQNYRKDSLTNDTLLLCEELEHDEDEAEDGVNNLEEGDDEQVNNRTRNSGNRVNSGGGQWQTQRQQQQQQQLYQQQHKHQRYHYHERTYEYYQNDDEVEVEMQEERDEQYDLEIEENEEDQTHYDITNIETYNSGGCGLAGEPNDRHRVAMSYDDNNEVAEDDDEYSGGNSYASASAKQRLRVLKQRAAARHKREPGVGGAGGSSSSSATVKSEGLGGANTSQDETSFSVPTSPISLSTPLIEKETANSVPTSPEPTSLGAVGGGGGGMGGDNGGGVVRRHNGIVRKCDSAGFRTSKSEDHLQQIQREGIAAVIPIDIDEDVNSSLNTLLDTRQDSEDSQPTLTTSTLSTTTIRTHITTYRNASANNESAEHTRHAAPSIRAPNQRDIFNRNYRRRVNMKIPRITLDPPSNSDVANALGMTTITTTTTTTTLNSTIPTTTTPPVTSTLVTTLNDDRVRLKKGSSRERIVWTYNAPLSQLQLQQLQQQQQQQQHYSSHFGNNSSPNSNSHSSSISSSPQHSGGSPASPTSVSSSVMSSSGSKGTPGGSGGNNAQHQPLQQQLPQQQQFNQTHPHQQQQYAGNMNGAVTGGTTGVSATGLLQCPTNGGGGNNMGTSGGGGGGDLSVSEAISNMSSPDYQDDDNLLSSRDLVGCMALSDPSDSDSTILVSDAQRQHHQKQQQQQQQQHQNKSSEHKLVIQVRGLDMASSPRSGHSEPKDSEDELATLTDDQPTMMLAGGSGNLNDGRDSSPPVSDDGSDVESLHSYHYSPKAVDMPSAIRLAKRLYSLDGFKKSDVSRHLSKNNDFSRAVADEYLKYFTFETKTLDQSLREFLQQFSLSGETQERERVLVHFSKRFLDCNPGTFNSQDAVHTLTCALMLLNTDLHGQNIGRKMSCADFIENLSDLNDGENFPKDVLKHLYQAIKTQPLEWALDDDVTDAQKQRLDNNMGGIGSGSQVLGQNPFLDLPESSTAVEYKKGYVMRKCCYDTNYKKTPFGKRSWKMFYCTLRDLVLFLHKDEHGFRKSQMSDNVHNAIRIHHALATKASDYTKKQHVFRLQTADQAEYLFQTSDSKELQSWVETINFVCAAYSAPPLEGGVGSQKRFQRPLLPSTHTKLLMKEQMDSHELQLAQLENTLSEHRKGPIPSKGLPLQNYKEKENFLQYELRRYKAYVSILNAKMLSDQQQQLQNELQTALQQQQQSQLTGNEEETDTFPSGGGRTPQQQIQANSINPLENQPPQQQQQSSNRKKEKKK